MPCTRQRRAWVAGAKVLAQMGQPMPRRALDAMRGVQCRACGFTGDGVTFGWDTARTRAYCPKCRSYDLTPGEAR